MPMEEDWGGIKLHRIDAGEDLWSIYYELMDDQSGFVHIRECIADAFKTEVLYGLRVVETDEMFARRAREDPIFCVGSWYMLPCFCIVDHESPSKVEIIWTHSRARKMGFGRKLIELLGITSARRALPGSETFWQRCNVTIDSS